MDLVGRVPPLLLIRVLSSNKEDKTLTWQKLMHFLALLEAIVMEEGHKTLWNKCMMEYLWNLAILMDLVILPTLVFAQLPIKRKQQKF